MLMNSNMRTRPLSSTRSVMIRRTALSRSPFLACLGRKLFSNSAAAKEKIYELRTYSIQPSRFVEFLKLTEEKIHLRTAHSKIIGYWSTELGGLNEVVHIWEYDSFEQRTGVRKRLAADKNWVESYMSKAFPMITSQTNAVMYGFSWNKLNLEPSVQKGIYVLLAQTLHSGKLAQWEHRMAQGLPSREKVTPSKGLWYSSFGNLNTVYQLWSYDSMDKCVCDDQKALQDEIWGETCRDTALFVQSSWRKALSPTAFSPLQ